MNNDRWYFAYGSNLFVDRKEQRTGSIREAIRSRLSGYRFVFNKRAKEGPIYANIVPDESTSVWGVAYLCSPEAFRDMDKCEGVANGHYERIPVKVNQVSGQTVEAITYVAGEDFVCQPGKPSSEYLDMIIDGARHHEIPEEYIRMIEALAK